MRTFATLRTIRFLSLLILLFPLHAIAGYVPVAVTGFNQDVVANGVGPAASSTTADVDGASTVFMAADFVTPAGVQPASYLPTSRMVYSVQTSGVAFQLQPYNVNNSLRVAATGSGTLNLVTPQAASEVYVLATAGSGGSSGSAITATVTFTDATTETITPSAVPDWHNAAGFAIRGIGRVNTGNNSIEHLVDNPRLYEVKLSLSPANYGKPVASITFTKTTTSGVLNVFAIAFNATTTCVAPPAQPTALLIAPAFITTAISFNPPFPAAEKYLIVRTPAGAALNTSPSNATSYAVNATLGNGIVAGSTSGNTFTDTGLITGTLYRYTIFAYNDLCTGGPYYNTTNPLTASVRTNLAADLAATGYTADVVADGSGSASSSITAGVDALYAFMAPNFNPSGSTFPTSSLPLGGLVKSVASPGVPYQLQPYTANNSLRLTATDSGTLTVTTPVSASDLYLLATSGGAPSSVVATIYFTDATFQQVTGVGISDWFGGGNFAILGLGRVEISSSIITNNTSDPRLYEIRLPINPLNYGKQIASVKIKKNAGSGIVHVMGMAVAVIGPCVTPPSQAVGMTLLPGQNTISLAFTAASPNPNRYLIVRTTNNATLSASPVNGITYAVNSSLGNGTIVAIQAGNTFLDAGLASVTNYRYTVFAYNDICGGWPVYNTTSPLSDSISTTSLAGRAYAWTGTENFTFANPQNWSPARRFPNAADTLIFNNGKTNAVYGVTSQTVRQFLVSNNTTVHLQASVASTLTLASDNNASTNELDIAAGSSLLLNANVNTASSLTIAFSGSGSTAAIAGNLESFSVSGAGLNGVNYTNAVATVAPSGTYTIGGTHTSAQVTGNTVANFLVNGTLNYRYFSTATPVIPIAAYGTGSTVIISGFASTNLTTSTTTFPAPGNIGQPFFNLSYDCRSQTAASAWAGAGPLNVAGTFSMIYSGSSSLGFSTTQGYNHQVKDFVQSGGILNLNTGVATAAPTLNVSGTFTQSAGTFASPGASTGANVPVLHFNGTAAQTASFFNAAPVGPIVYRFSNPAGVTLSGTGTLTGAFNINTNGGVRISTTAATPLTTALALTYNASGSTLTYDAPGNLTATATVFPAAGGPANLTINTGGSGNVLSLPFSRTVPGTLNMTSGDINVAANTLTLGTSATAAGTLTYTAGFIRTGTGGAFARWFGTAGLPTSAGTGAGFYPLGYNGLSRAVSVSFSSATALSAGGTIAASHTNAAGFTNGLSVTDGAYTIDTRTNSSWNFTTSGVTASGTIGMQLTGAGLFSSPNPANLRVMKAAAVAGTHVAGFGQSAQRSGLSVSDLSAAHYIGAAAADITGVYTAINTGNWSTGTTWDIGSAPGSANEAFINPGVVVSSNATTNVARSLTLLPGATLNVATGNTVTLDTFLVNNGTLNLNGGTINLGPTGGGRMPFLQNGVLNVSGGTLNINGYLNAGSGAQNIQTGGAINIDGNAAGVAANSVACGIPLLYLQNAANTFSGGSLTIVDPHTCATTASTSSLSYAFIYANAANIAASGTHIFRAGDGISTDAGGSATNNFNLNPGASGKFAFWDLVVNAGTGTNRYVIQNQTNLGVAHDLVVNNGGEYRQASGQTTYVGNDMTVNTGGTYTGPATTYFGNYATGTVAASANTQTISGGGTFRDAAAATPAAKFASITINNSGGGLNFNIGNVPYSGTLTFVLGRMFMGATTMVQNGGAGVSGASQATGWVVGKFQKAAAVGGMNHQFPIGDATYYTPITVKGTTATKGDLIASTTTGDHPSLSSSLMNPSRSVNRYWTLSMINGLAVSSSGVTIEPVWNAADVDAGATPASFAGGRFNAAAWTPATISGAAPTTLVAAVAATNIDGDYAFGETCSPLAITTQPQAQTSCSGNAVTFSVGVGGTAGVTYQWSKNGNPISGATGASYTIPSVAVGDAGSYTVELNSQCGGVTPMVSAAAALVVNAAPTVTTQPVSRAVCENSPVTFSIVASGSGLNYQWLFNGTPIAGATTASYSISSVTPADAGSYSVAVSGASICRNDTSVAAVLTVNALPLTITAASTTTFCAGGSVVLNAAPGYSYQWQLNAVNITGATSASYTANTSGSFTVIISNTTTGCSGTSNAIAVLANSPPVSTITPAGTAAYCSGGTVTLSGPAVGGLAYQWNLNGTPITGATGATYAANAVGNYTLAVSAGTGCSSTSPITAVSMNPLPTATATASGGTTICAGAAVTLNANTGTGLSYAWNLNGVPVSPAATGASFAAAVAGNYSVTVTNTATGCQNTSTAVAISVSALPTATVTAAGAVTFCAGDSVLLNANTGAGLSYVWNLNAAPLSPAVTTQRLAAKSSGSYTVTVTDNATGCQNTSAASVVTANALPNVTVSAGGSLSICAGSSVKLSVPASAGQTYQWRANGANVTGATRDTFMANTAGAYSVRVTTTGTGCTDTSLAAIVIVNPLPTATITAVGSTSACQGDTVWLNGNTGSGLSYQWQRNGSAISGATGSSYPATATGSYTVVVTNGNNCATTSAQTNVTVNPRPLSSISYTTPVTFCEGGAVVLTAISGSGVSYQWYNNAVQMPGATGNFFIANTSGNYTVTVMNSFGCTETSPSILVVVNPLPQPAITRANFLLSTGSYDTYQWYLNSLPITGSTGQSHMVTQNGGYTVRVTDANGCTNYAPVFFFNSVGLPQVLLPGMISVFPNPANDFVNINAPVKVNVMLRDVAGRVISRQEAASRVDLSALPEGVYQLVISDQQGHYLKTEKIIHTGR